MSQDASAASADETPPLPPPSRGSCSVVLVLRRHTLRSTLTLCLSLLPRRAGVLLLHAQDSDHPRGAADLELRLGPPAGEDASSHTDGWSVRGNAADGRSSPFRR